MYQVSFNGGGWPRWKKGDGRELYFSGLANPGSTNYSTTASAPLLYTVAVRASGSAFSHESPREILRSILLNPAHSGGAYHVYDVSPDGQRFVLFQVAVAPAAVAATAVEADPPQNFILAFNWANTLKK